MSSQAIGQRFRLLVSRGGCWQRLPGCRCRLADALSFFLVAYNYSLNHSPSNKRIPWPYPNAPRSAKQ
jgi:hypothetical protein